MATLKAVNLKEEEEERTNVCSPYWSPFTQRPLILNRNAFVNPTRLGYSILWPHSKVTNTQ